MSTVSVARLHAGSRELVDLALGEPVRAIAHAEVLLSEAHSENDDAAAANAWWAIAIARRVLGEYPDALQAIEQGLEFTRPGESARCQLLTTRAVILVYIGQTEDAWSALESAGEAAACPADDALVKYQSAGVLARLGRWEEARALFVDAIPLLELTGQHDFVGNALMNLGIGDAERGECDRARQRMTEAQNIFLTLGMPWAAASAEHNLGFISSRAGDFQRALEHFDRAAEMFAEQERPLAHLALDHCEALLSVGLAQESLQRCRDLVGDLERHGDGVNAADALMFAAISAMRCDQHDDARRYARMARERFEDQQRGGWPDLAELVEAQATTALGEHSIDLEAQMKKLADRLHVAGRHLPSIHAQLLRVQAISVSEPARALDELGQAALANALSHAPVEYRLLGESLRVRAMADLDRWDEAEAHAADAVAGLETYLQMLGAVDVKVHLAAYASSIVEVGLRARRRANDAEGLLRWVERSQSMALHHAPVRPPDEARVRQLLDRLRMTTGPLHSDAGDDARATASERLELQSKLAITLRRGTGASSLTAFSTDAVIESLRGAPALVLIDVGPDIVAVVLTNGPSTPVHVADTRELRERLQAAMFAHRRMLRYDAGAAREAARGRMAAHIRWLDDVLNAVLPEGRGPIVLVVPPWLAVLPIGLLPCLTQRDVVVTPTLSQWRNIADRPVSRRTQALLVAGSDLAHARDEVDRLASVWEMPVVVKGGTGSVDRAREHIESSDVVHLCAHHTIATGNPSFSAVWLADGPLYAHELQLVRQAPEVVVLAGCDTARSEEQGAAALLGAVHCLLSAGVRSVIASPSLVEDTDLTTSLFVGVHARLRAGLPAATALAEAQRTLYLADPMRRPLFTCFGAG